MNIKAIISIYFIALFILFVTLLGISSSEVSIPPIPSHAKAVAEQWLGCPTGIVVLATYYDYDGKLDYAERVHWYLKDETLIAVGLFKPDTENGWIALYLLQLDGSVKQYSGLPDGDPSLICTQAKILTKKGTNI